jgi:hypothetical protein
MEWRQWQWQGMRAKLQQGWMGAVSGEPAVSVHVTVP